MFSGENTSLVLLMFKDSSFYIIRDSCIEHGVILIRQDVNAVLFFHSQPAILMTKGFITNNEIASSLTSLIKYGIHWAAPRSVGDWAASPMTEKGYASFSISRRRSR
jgi:hypothetical protein